MRYIDSGKQKDILDETMKVFYRAIKWRMSQNDCSNRGFILYNFPRFQSELDLVFTKVTAKKLKRIRPKKPVKAPEPAPPSMSQKTVISSGDVEKE